MKNRIIGSEQIINEPIDNLINDVYLITRKEWYFKVLVNRKNIL